MATKMVIKGFRNSQMTNFINEFKVPINPENLSRSYHIKQEETQPQATQQTNPNFNRTQPEELRFDLYLDNTNTVEGNTLNKVDIKTQLQKFADVAYKMNGDINKPNFLKIIWGDLLFDCQLTSLGVEYKLFNTEGVPLRAKLAVSFKRYIDPTARVIDEGKSLGAAVEKIVQAAAGDKITNIADKVLTNINAYLDIARANNIVNFRGIKEGVELVIQPIQEAATAVGNAANQVSNAANNIGNQIGRLF